MTDERSFRLKPWRWKLPARLLWALVGYGHDAEKLSSVVDHILQSYRVQTTDLKRARKAKDRFDALSIAAGRTRTMAGIAMEFGVFQGVTLRHIAKEIGPERRVIGFDTFEGLPDDWGDLLEKGTFATKLPSFEDQKNVSLEVGRIEATLPEFLRRAPEPISLVHIDCPFYDINIFILERVLPFMAPGSVVVFDEYYGYPTYEDHEFKAWSEMRSRFELGVVPIAYSSRSAAFRIERNPRYTA
jgi:predicted O-methyltransferase YrrM